MDISLNAQDHFPIRYYCSVLYEKFTPYYSNESELMYNMNEKTDLIRSNDENVEKHHD